IRGRTRRSLRDGDARLVRRPEDVDGHVQVALAVLARRGQEPGVHVHLDAREDQSRRGEGRVARGAELHELLFARLGTELDVLPLRRSDRRLVAELAIVREVVVADEYA